MELSSYDWRDPVQRLIDRQLSSVWRSHQLQKRQNRGKWIVKVKEQFPAKNRLEEEMVAALDAKHFGVRSRDRELLEFYAKENCYTQQDIATILGRSQSWVSRNLRELSGGYVS